jgi:glutamate carboxypeptidase
MKTRASSVLLISASLACLPVLGAGHPREKLLAAVTACGPGSRHLLEQVVAIDSGTGDAEGLKAVGDLYAAELEGLGANVRRVASVPPATGDNLEATLVGAGKGRVLLIAHMDTVFGRGDVARHPPHWDGEHYVGLGAGDDKSGGVTAVCVLRALGQIGYHDFARIDLLLNASEEVGSPGSRELIRSMAAQSDLAINLERGLPTDRVLVARKGSAVLTMEFTGVAAHSGLEPEKGRNAALEAAHMALALGELGNPQTGTTVTVDILSGGDRTNVVPAHAILKADVRSFSSAEFDGVERAAAELAAHPSIEGVTIKSSLERDFPPWPHTAATDRIVAHTSRLFAEIGRTLSTTEVGSSADVAIAAGTGTPAIDGFGMEGGGAHTFNDFADLSTLVPRAYVLARLLMDVGHDPKGL